MTIRKGGAKNEIGAGTSERLVLKQNGERKKLFGNLSFRTERTVVEETLKQTFSNLNFESEKKLHPG